MSSSSSGSLSFTPEDICNLLDLSMAYHTTDIQPTARQLPVCIWGPPGIGKTELVQSYARERQIRIILVHPAQFEEMGDLLGMPYSQDGKTFWAQPAWVPTEPGPGILLLDDLNRADARILNGLMSLLQTGQLASWSLPPSWWIVATANPEELSFAVTPLDDAIAGRMQHIQLRYDRSSWFAWAASRKLDIRGLGFLHHYPDLLPEIVSPRQAAQFLELMALIPSSNHGQLRLLATSMLPPDWAERLMTWMTLNQPDWLKPERFLDLEDPKTPLHALQEKLTPESALACKLELLNGIRPFIGESLSRSDRKMQNVISLLADSQINGNLILAFLHHFPASSPIHQAVLDAPQLREKIL